MKSKFETVKEMLLVCNGRSDCVYNEGEETCKYYAFCHNSANPDIDSYAEEVEEFAKTI